MSTEADLIDWRERVYVSRDGTQTFGIVIQGPGGEFDPDGNEVVGTWVRQSRNGDTEVAEIPAVRKDVGKYEVTVRSAHTDTAGNYRLDFKYLIGGVPEVYRVYAVVGESNPDYDRLPPDFKEIVDSVWIRFADLFDSPSGGPNLQTYFQSHWSRGRVAQLMKIALGRINTMQQPFGTYSMDGSTGERFPVDQWGSLLETMTYVESVKHLIRSYVEQPMLMTGSNITRQDRRDCMDRWRTILDMEEDVLRGQLDVFKISRLSLSVPSVLVSGGAYGRFAPTRIAGMAGRPRYFYRWYA